ncbi:MAG: UbiA family prenyltransferase [Desulfarculaceae bacterium]|nr:UbiA family prenyltransferase [Desulfarculaceae bacterium]
MTANALNIEVWRQRLGLFLALSRTPHGILDLATPAVAALLWLGAFPPLSTTLLGLITAFAGYTSVYALNDLVDVASDRDKLAASPTRGAEGYLDAVGVRHPVAQGLLSLPAAVGWFALWSLVAMTGAYLLNPVCLVLFLAGAGLEIFYCLLLKITHLRTYVSGLVKTVGGVAAVFAVDPAPSPWFLLALWAWLFCWEIGGQNIPADWHDITEDRGLGARTLPVVYGARRASLLVLLSLGLAVVLSLVVLALAPLRTPWPFALLAWVAGLYLLILPAWDLWQSQARGGATRLFNRASYYPLTMLTLALLSLLARTPAP